MNLSDIYHEESERMKPKDLLDQMHFEYHHVKHPNFPAEYIPKRKKGKTPANQLTSDVIQHIDMSGGWATRVNTSGRVLNGKYIPGTTKNGTPDIIGCIKGKFVGIEIKIGRDKQSEAQRKVEADIQRAKGLYIIVHNLDEWFNYYNKI